MSNRQKESMTDTMSGCIKHHLRGKDGKVEKERKISQILK